MFGLVVAYGVRSRYSFLFYDVGGGHEGDDDDDGEGKNAMIYDTLGHGMMKSK